MQNFSSKISFKKNREFEIPKSRGVLEFIDRQNKKKFKDLTQDDFDFFLRAAFISEHSKNNFPGPTSYKLEKPKPTILRRLKILLIKNLKKIYGK